MRKLWPKYENWSKLGTEQQLYRYMSNMYRYMLAKNDQKRKCTGTSSKCTGTSHPKCPKMCVFSHFPYISTPINSILHIHLKTISYSFCNLFSIQFLFQYLSLLQKSIMNYSQITLIWVMTHTQAKYKDFVLGFVLTQLFHLAINP